MANRNSILWPIGRPGFVIGAQTHLSPFPQFCHVTVLSCDAIKFLMKKVKPKS